MKSHLHTIISLTAMLLSSCDRTPPTPTPTATTTPTPIPQVRTTPEGTLLVLKPFSVATDTGLHGFRIGQQVKIVSHDDSNYKVTDGEITGTAPKSHFTNDIDKVAALVDQINQRNAEHIAAQKEAQRRIQEQRAVDEKQRQLNVANSRLQQIERKLIQLDAAIAAASNSLEDVYRAKARGGYIYDAYGNRIGARASSASGNEHQLTQNLQRWNAEKQLLQTELKTLNAEKQALQTELMTLKK